MRRAAVILAALSLAACPRRMPKAPANESVDATAKRVLGDKAYVFCHENKLPVSGDDRDWCDVADQATTCPELKVMCGRPVPPGLLGKTKSKSKAVEKPAATVGGGNADTTPWYLKIHLPGIEYLVWLVLGAIVALVVFFFIVRAVLNRRTDGFVDEPAPEPLQDGGVLVLEERGLGEVARLLRLARELADRDVALALAHLYAAALKHLEEAGLIRWDRAKTNREYVRAIRGRTELDRPVAELVREFEKVKFGHAPPARSTFDELYARLAPRLARALTVLVVVFAMFTNACSACGFGNPGLEGHAAFADVLRSRGVTVTSFAMPINRLTGRDAPVMVDGADFPFDEKVLSSLERSMLSGARVLVLLDPTTKLDDWPMLKVADDAAGPLTASTAFAKAMQLPEKVAGALPGKAALVVPDSERDAPDVLMERHGEPFALRWRSQKGELVFVADRRIVANASLAVPDNARLAMALAKEVIGDRKALQFARLGPIMPAASPLESLERAGLWALVLQALLALIVLVLARGRAFGQMHAREVTERRAFSEHVSALGLQLRRRRGSRLAASLYASFALERLRERLGRDVGRDVRALAKELAPRLGESEDDVRLTLDQAETARSSPTGVSVPSQDLALVRRLGRMLARLQIDRRAPASRAHGEHE